MKNLNQTIKCSVHSCKYNNDIEYLCTLEKIDVLCTCNEDKCKNKTETICDSFEKKEN
ncbi:MAG: DUF1540 domain-containing protein [Bacilli bacterium]|nr:DUF1540 domain-containing protein [Bacilli bacterium]